MKITNGHKRVYINNMQNTKYIILNHIFYIRGTYYLLRVDFLYEVKQIQFNKKKTQTTTGRILE